MPMSSPTDSSTFHECRLCTGEQTMAMSSPTDSRARAKALQESTLPTTLAFFSNLNERWDVPPIQESERAHYQKWLESSGFLGESDPEKWNAICRNWISFLSATSAMPKVALAPRGNCHGPKIRISTAGPESLEAQTSRFGKHRRTRHCIQKAVWQEFDKLEVLAERWPAQARLIVNQSDWASGTKVFESWAARVNLGKRRRGNSMWTGLISFVIYAYQENTLEEMGLILSKKPMDSIFYLFEAEVWYSGIGQTPPDVEGGPVEWNMLDLCKEFIMDRRATCTTNPLLWWVGILVKSSLQDGADDYISRGRFNFNLLPMDLDIKGRLEGLLHYSKVFILDHTMDTWKASEVWKSEVHGDMADVCLEWLHAYDDQRPEAAVDKQDCSSMSWKDILSHLQSQCNKYLGKQRGTAAWQLRLLLEGFSKL